jgi:acyl-homoserine lactone acylase PvdQ
MRPLVLPLSLLLVAAAQPQEIQSWRDRAARITITRDDFGIAHIEGPTDADAVFGMIYAQAEDDFPRIEANYLTALGRTAEAEGEKAIWQDLRARLYVSENELKADYALSPDWLKRLMDAWAAGLNHYLATHPDVKPRVLTRFEPWMALSFTEGSIGGDIERIDLKELERFYSSSSPAVAGEGDHAKHGGGVLGPKLSRTPPSALRAATSPRTRGGGCRSRTARLQRHCHCAGADHRRQGAAPDQPAHQLLLPLRAAGDERRGAQRLWRGDLGAVLHLPGLPRYGTSGNSFVAVVEFGPRVRARAVSAGGESGDPASPHFNDQAARYAAGALRPVYFHADELKGHIERRYRPGE